MYNYKATINRVIDGDTINATIDLGFNMALKTNCRLAGINAPEMKGETYQEGAYSKAHLQMLLGLPSHLNVECTIDSKSLDKYGRPLVVIWHKGVNINIKMITDKMAKEY
jgi:micrococcal nuclease